MKTRKLQADEPRFREFGPVRRIEAVAKALSDQVRIRILLSIQDAPLNLQQMTQMFGLAPSTMSKHLHLLENAGLIGSERSGRWRYFRAAGSAMDGVARTALEWLKAASAGDPLLDTDAARRSVALSTRPAPLPAAARSRVLFLCTANACRSQMAEGILRHYGGPNYEVFSAGVSPRAIPPLTVEVMREIGIDIRHQMPKRVMDLIGRMHFDYLITVCPVAEKQTPVFPGVARRIHWPLEDPLKAKGNRRQRLAVYRRVRDELVTKITRWIGMPRVPKAPGGAAPPPPTAVADRSGRPRIPATPLRREPLKRTHRIKINRKKGDPS